MIFFFYPQTSVSLRKTLKQRHVAAILGGFLFWGHIVEAALCHGRAAVGSCWHKCAPTAAAWWPLKIGPLAILCSCQPVTNVIRSGLFFLPFFSSGCCPHQRNELVLLVCGVPSWHCRAGRAKAVQWSGVGTETGLAWALQSAAHFLKLLLGGIWPFQG